MTNSEYFSSSCNMLDHICIINRMAQAVIRERVGMDAPIWEKERIIDAWLMEPFDLNAWAKACVIRSIPTPSAMKSSSVPKYGHKIA